MPDQSVRFDRRYTNMAGVYIKVPQRVLAENPLANDVLDPVPTAGSDSNTVNDFAYKEASRGARLLVTDPQLSAWDSEFREALAAGNVEKAYKLAVVLTSAAVPEGPVFGSPPVLRITSLVRSSEVTSAKEFLAEVPTEEMAHLISPDFRLKSLAADRGSTHEIIQEGPTTLNEPSNEHHLVVEHSL